MKNPFQNEDNCNGCELLSSCCRAKDPLCEKCGPAKTEPIILQVA